MTSKTLGQRPSSLIAEKDEFIAYQIDRAVLTFGVTIDNALLETIEIGDEGKTIPKYELSQLLDESFYLPRGQADTEALEGVSGVMFDTV